MDFSGLAKSIRVRGKAEKVFFKKGFSNDKTIVGPVEWIAKECFWWSEYRKNHCFNA